MPNVLSPRDLVFRSDLSNINCTNMITRTGETTLYRSGLFSLGLVLIPTLVMHNYIMLTNLCNLYPTHTPHLYGKTGVNSGIQYFSYFCFKTEIVGTC